MMAAVPAVPWGRGCAAAGVRRFGRRGTAAEGVAAATQLIVNQSNMHLLSIKPLLHFTVYQTASALYSPLQHGRCPWGSTPPPQRYSRSSDTGPPPPHSSETRAARSSLPATRRPRGG